MPSLAMDLGSGVCWYSRRHFPLLRGEEKGAWGRGHMREDWEDREVK